MMYTKDTSSNCKFIGVVVSDTLDCTVESNLYSAARTLARIAASHSEYAKEEDVLRVAEALVLYVLNDTAPTGIPAGRIFHNGRTIILTVGSGVTVLLTYMADENGEVSLVMFTACPASTSTGNICATEPVALAVSL